MNEKTFNLFKVEVETKKKSFMFNLLKHIRDEAYVDSEEISSSEGSTYIHLNAVMCVTF